MLSTLLLLGAKALTLALTLTLTRTPNPRPHPHPHPHPNPNPNPHPHPRPNPKARARDSGGMGAVHWACRMGNLDLVKALLHAGASLNAPSGHKLMPLAEAAAEASLKAERAI